jgi:xylulokinase
MRDELLLGIDLGTSSIKANAIDRHGRSLGLGVAPTPFVRTANGVEMSPEAVFEAVQAAIAQLGELRRRVVGVGIASMGETGTTIHADGPSGLPLVAWHDDRGGEVVADLVAEFGADALLRRTGRAARSVTSIAKIGWLQRNGARLAGTWTGVAGLTLWRLTGALGQEHSLAATSGAYDPIRREYDRDILRATGLDGITWAPARVAGTVLGRISPSGFAWSGLPAGIPVTIAGHDHPVGVVGAGGERDEVIDSLGTGEPLVVSWEPQNSSSHPVIPGQPGDLTVTAWPGTARHMLLWETLRPGLALSHLLDGINLAHPGTTRNDIEFAAIRVEAEPLDAPSLLAMQDGEVPADLLTLPPEVAWAATLEGFAAAAAEAERALRALAGIDGTTLLIGGGLRSRRWIEAKLHRACAPVAMAAEREAVSRGAALLAGVAAEWWKAEAYPPADIVPMTEPAEAAVASPPVLGRFS